MRGTSWKLRGMEIHKCNKWGYEFTFRRYGDILKIAGTRTGRCTEWSMLFGAIMNALDAETRIVHDFLDHCWNEVSIHGQILQCCLYLFSLYTFHLDILS